MLKAVELSFYTVSQLQHVETMQKRNILEPLPQVGVNLANLHRYGRNNRGLLRATCAQHNAHQEGKSVFALHCSILNLFLGTICQPCRSKQARKVFSSLRLYMHLGPHNKATPTLSKRLHTSCRTDKIGWRSLGGVGDIPISAAHPKSISVQEWCLGRQSTFPGLISRCAMPTLCSCCNRARM